LNKRGIELLNESDRGCVLVGAAMLERSLDNIFKCEFKKNKVPLKVQSSIFDSNGALSNFSSKVKLAYSLGFIDKPLYEDLESVRKIRNDFAHSTIKVDFLNSPVTAKIESMHCVQQFRGKIKRYSLSKKIDSKGIPDEHICRVAGYIKYTKTIFCLGILQIEADLSKITLKRFRSCGC
jgi:DNA-binding MltR family transcriptional regulator